ncbi:hypothetical protein ACFQ08_13640 [Streptosporangium algeriense]|uniref:Uncharacterized protein n=1 Tax=Streptosporangium algeriense TaxID=1682748 RepID=A0ABW3DSD2_9ACTN
MTRKPGDMVGVLTQADPIRKAKVYEDIGLRPIYHPSGQKVLVTS